MNAVAPVRNWFIGVLVKIIIHGILHELNIKNCDCKKHLK